jgi:hypothetical protein
MQQAFVKDDVWPVCHFGREEREEVGQKKEALQEG